MAAIREPTADVQVVHDEARLWLEVQQCSDLAPVQLGLLAIPSVGCMAQTQGQKSAAIAGPAQLQLPGSYPAETSHTAQTLACIGLQAAACMLQRELTALHRDGVIAGDD